jgi:hypothetical protein
MASSLFANLPLYPAESGLLSLCTTHFLLLPSDPAVTSNALAIRIAFPLVRAAPSSLRRSGIPPSPVPATGFARFAGQTKKQESYKNFPALSTQ